MESHDEVADELVRLFALGRRLEIAQVNEDGLPQL